MITPRKPATLDPPDFSRVFYPDPPSHDFCVWLIIAELMRRQFAPTSQLRVKFGLMDGQLGMRDFGPLSPWDWKCYECGLSKEYSDQMMANVLRPAMNMIGAIEDRPVYFPFPQESLGGWVEYDYHIWQLVDAARAGYKLPKWQIPQWALDEVNLALGGRKPIVITLREIPAQPERNSNIEEWLKFARSIKERDRVLFLRDTCNAEERLEFPTWPKASRNAYLRAALYQRSLVNLFVGNGPNVWCMFSDAPYLMFKQLVPALAGRWAHGDPRGWLEQDHMAVGDQWPWAGDNQRMTWKDDTFDNIRGEFEQFVESSKDRIAA